MIILLPNLTNEKETCSIGDYVLLTKYSDRDVEDPWVIGFLSEYGKDSRGMFYKVEGMYRCFRHIWDITEQEGHDIVKKYCNI